MRRIIPILGGSMLAIAIGAAAGVAVIEVARYLVGQ